MPCYPRPTAGDALIIVDVQKDFLPGGALAVPSGNDVITPLRHAIAQFHRVGLPIFASRDWHPPDHISFQGQGGPWPPHCVAGTPGAEIVWELALTPEAVIISKGTESGKEAYSAFQGTDLAQRLRELGSKCLWIGGLATDYCVRQTVIDALQEGFEVIVINNGISAVEIKPGDGARAIEEMKFLGARFQVAWDLG